MATEKHQHRIGLVEDDLIMAESIRQRLQLEGYQVDWWPTGGDALKKIIRQPVDLLLSDIRLPDMDGDTLFEKIKPTLGRTPVIFITAFGRIEQAVRLIQLGANDYLTKPFPMEDLLERISLLLTGSRQHEVSLAFEDEHNLLITQTKSPLMRSVVEQMNRVCDLDSNLVITGESGVGKELAAYYVHSRSSRNKEPFIPVNCASIPSELLESELFGYEKGAFTGAAQRNAGYMETVMGGTMLLDEIGDLPLMMQGKLLRVLEERRFYRIGSRTAVPFRARVICATHKNLEQMVKQDEFRMDLFYRINVISIHLPSLRERSEDLIHLAQYFLIKCSEKSGGEPLTFSADVQSALLAYSFPGNIRELRNRIERAVAFCRGRVITPMDIFPENQPMRQRDENLQGIHVGLHSHMEEEEKRYILGVLEKNQWKITQAATELNISRKTLWEKMRRYHLHAEIELNGENF